MLPIFFYGTLRDETLLRIVLGRPLAAGETRPARAPGHAACRLVDQDYPMLAAIDGAVAEGLLLEPPDADGMARLAFFEEAEYGLCSIVVETGRGAEEALYFRATGKVRASAERWDYAEWRDGPRAVAVEAARELMDLYGRLPTERIDEVWDGIMVRARQRARGGGMRPVIGGVRREAAPGDVVIERRVRPYTGYLAVEELTLRHRAHDGDWLGPLERTAVLWGDAVTVLPYDAGADRVLLIEQFRPGPAARGDPNPWCIEVVAGRIDRGETAEATARREAHEEAGIGLGRFERIGDHYPSPGLAAECLTAFVGEARLDAGGGLHGSAGEDEDIRTLVLSFEEAMAAVSAGAVNTGPALVSLLWLARERARLRAAWCA